MIKRIINLQMFLNNKLNSFYPDNSKWYNLDTNRSIKSSQGKCGLSNPRVVSNYWELIYEFIQLNNLDPKNLKFLTKAPEFIKLCSTKIVQPSTKDYLTTNHIDITLINDDILNQIEEFSFSRIRTKGKIIRIIDGDTIVVALILSKGDLDSFFWKRENKNSQAPKNITKKCLSQCYCNDQLHMLIKLRLRLYGIDTAEKNTKTGKIAIKFVTQKYKSLDSIVYLHLLGTDARGRTLANIYEDEKYTKCINSQILAYEDQQVGKIAVPYFGGTKVNNFK